MNKKLVKLLTMSNFYYFNNIYCKSGYSNSGKEENNKSTGDGQSTGDDPAQGPIQEQNDQNKGKGEGKEKEKEKEKEYNPEQHKSNKENYIRKTKELRNKFGEYYNKIKDKTSDEVSNIVSNHLSGFINHGNTCYFNAAIQNLTHNKELVKTIIDYVSKAADKDNVDIEIIAFYCLIVKIYEQEEERGKDNNKKTVIDEELEYLRYFIAFKGILDEFYIGNRENFFTSEQQDSQELLSALIDDIETTLGNDNPKIFDIFNDERVKCNTIGHKEDQRSQKATTKQYNFEENIKKIEGDKKFYNSINEFINKQTEETLKEKEGSVCLECLKEELKMKDPNFDTNIKNEYKKILDCSKCKTIYEGINDEEKPKKGGYISINKDTICHCEICDKIYNSNCTNCKEIHNKMCKEKVSKCSNDQRKNKTIKLKTINNYLIIQLVRFEDTKNKIDDEIEFEENLNFNEKNEKFDLVGIICQYGSLNSGHYFSYNKINGKWYLFNDNNVSPVTNNKILDVQKIKSQNYILFYKKQ